MADELTPIVVGVDTHADNHVAVVIDHVDRRLDSLEVPATVAGHERLVNWASGLGAVEAFRVEGTGSYGAGLSRYLANTGVKVVEVGRVNRQHRRRNRKTDSVDAEAAARAVLSGDAAGVPKTRDSYVESIRVLHLVKRSAIKARTQAANQVTNLIVTAPDPTRKELSGLTALKRARLATKWRPDPSHDPATVTRHTIKVLARRWLDLNEEIKAHNQALDELVQLTAPNLVAQPSVSRDVATKLLITAGDNPERIGTEAGFAALCGASPIEASSGKTVRHRLNRSGDRQANNALWVIAMVRLSHDPETRAYAERRKTDGLSRREIVRCLKRYIARRLHPTITADLQKT